jgi:hypothetical protein
MGECVYVLQPDNGENNLFPGAWRARPPLQPFPPAPVRISGAVFAEKPIDNHFMKSDQQHVE